MNPVNLLGKMSPQISASANRGRWILITANRQLVIWDVVNLCIALQINFLDNAVKKNIKTEVIL